MNFLRQCLLRRGTTQQIVWIEDKLARPGNYVRIRDEDGWQVVAAWQRAPVDSMELTADGRNLRRLFGSIDQ